MDGMSRYVRAHKPLYVESPLWDDAEPLRPDLTVDDCKTVDTGLISVTGESIMRLPNPIGFGRDEEW